MFVLIDRVLVSFLTSSWKQGCEKKKDSLVFCTSQKEKCVDQLRKGISAKGQCFVRTNDGTL